MKFVFVQTKLDSRIQRITSKICLQSILIILICIGFLIPNLVIAYDKIEKAGDILQVLIPATAYGTTFYLDDQEGRGQFYKSFATTLLVTHGLKNLIHKKRPNGSDHSFPSGHTSAAFQGASFIHKRYGIKYAVFAYIGAFFVGYSRIESNNHYLEDVIAGAVIGIASSFYFTRPYKGFTITPTAYNGTYELRLIKQW